MRPASRRRWDGARQAAEQVLRNVGVDPTGMAPARRQRPVHGRTASRRASSSTSCGWPGHSTPRPFTLMFEPDAMPVSGVSGTLDDRYGRFTTKQSRCAQGDVRAKTGTLFDTIGLSGVATTRDRAGADLRDPRQRPAPAILATVHAPGGGRPDRHHHRLLGLTSPIERGAGATAFGVSRLSATLAEAVQRRARAISPAARATRGPTSASFSSRSARTPTLASSPGTPSTGTAMP